MSNKYLKKLKTLVKSALKSSSNEVKTARVQSHKIPPDYTLDFDIAGITPHALHTAQNIRKSDRPPAIIIHGVMKRSGTVYTGELLRLHPDIYAYPNEIWEIPFLRFLGKILDFEENFLKVYPQNKGKIGDRDFLPLFGAAFIDYLYSMVPDGKRMLLKVPTVQYLNYFPSVFPYETLLLLMRDGRDIVQSTLKTWSTRKFSDVCHEWNNSAKMMLGFDAYYGKQKSDFMYIKYENILDNPLAFVKTACDRYNLDFDRFPGEAINELPVRGSSSIKPEGQVTWQATEKPQKFKSTHKWLEWSDEEKQTFKEIAGQSLIDTGYENNFDW